MQLTTPLAAHASFNFNKVAKTVVFKIFASNAISISPESGFLPVEPMVNKYEETSKPKYGFNILFLKSLIVLLINSFLILSTSGTALPPFLD